MDFFVRGFLWAVSFCVWIWGSRVIVRRLFVGVEGYSVFVVWGDVVGVV